MILHLVTDRRRLCASADERTRQTCLLEQARHAVDAGIDVIQLRERDMEAGPLSELAAGLLKIARGSATRVVINERLDIALAVGADGVHLRGDSFGADRVRSCVPPGFLVGRSIHSRAELEHAGPLDYVIAGTVWETVSKPGKHDLLGLDGLSALVSASRVPVIAIGGVDASRVPALAGTGAAGIAGIGMFQGPEAACRAIALRETAEVLHNAFSAGKM
ncbi:MAG: thiamine phosphate synthase [Vicinamibacterales bacterium]